MTSFEGDSTPEPRPGRPPRDPAATLQTAMLVYIVVNLIYAIPLVLVPVDFFDLIGLDESASDLAAFRWLGAVLLAWGVAGILVMARPGGRAIFVTAGSLQLSFAAAALLFSWSVGEYKWDLWYQVITTLVMLVGALYLWWARMRARDLFKGNQASA